MTPEIFNYRDYVPAMVYTVEAKRIEDLLQADYSRPAQTEDEELSPLAREVIDGLRRMIADFKAKPVAREVLGAAMAGVRADLETSQEHERILREQVETVDQMRAQMESVRPTRRGRSEHRKLLAKIANLRSDAEHELRQSERISAAYAATLKELEVIPPKVLTREEQQQVEWIDKRLVLLQEFQEKIKNNPEDAAAIAEEYMGRLGERPPFQFSGPLEALFPPEQGTPVEVKSARQRLDERSAFMLAGALICALPSVLIEGASFALLMGVLGMMTGSALYPLVENRL